MPELEKYMKPWKRFVGDTIYYIKPNFITDIIDILNKFHESIKFTYEVEHNGSIFLDVLLMRSYGKLAVGFYKDTYNSTYLHWRSFAQLHGKKVH